MQEFKSRRRSLLRRMLWAIQDKINDRIEARNEVEYVKVCVRRLG